MTLIRSGSTTLAQLRKILFGTHRARPRETEQPAGGNTQPDGRQDGEREQGFPSDPTSGEDAGADERDRPKPPRRRRRGHGRISADEYTGCQQVIVTHESLTPGDPCPHCQDGTLYRLKDWIKKIRLQGQPLVGGTCYELERLRCGLCGKLETAELPEDAGTEKYDASVPSIIATYRYGLGMPWSRIQQVQRAAGIPLPASTQWELVRDAIQKGVGAAYQHLLQVAAQGELVHNDDTGMRVLELTTRLKNQLPLREDDPDRYGVFTTGILSMAKERPNIALFFTGPRHAGENMHDLLKRRLAGLPPPLQMCDGLSRNIPKDIETEVAQCLIHGRRHFEELEDVFPAEVKHVLKSLSMIYRVEREAKQRNLSPEARLRLHREWSKPVMDALHRWLQDQFDQRRVEPNSSLGQAISYLLKRWSSMTMFLRVPGAPLDNNICERALKMAIRHRKNSLFYKTLRGAAVGDIYMSLINTCLAAKVDPYAYLTTLQRNAAAVTQAPENWMPWNYQLNDVSANPNDV